MRQPAIIACGDRNWTDHRAVNAVIASINPRLVIQGDARGADRIAGVQADFLGIAQAVFPADWERFGRAAGPRRNQQMLDRLMDEPEPRMVVAFHDNLEDSKGTADMVRRARRAGVSVKVVKHKKRSKV